MTDRELGSKQPPDEDADAAARALLALVRENHLPGSFVGEPAWHVVAAALVARMADTVESILALMKGRRALDMLILLRTLYEQVVMFSWLAIDPPATPRQ